MEGSGHKGVILYRVGEHHQLGTAKASLVLGALGQVPDGPAHHGDRVHVDARLGGAHVDAGAHDVCRSQGLRDGGDKPPVSQGHTLLNQGGEAADEVDAAGLCRPVQGQGEGGIVLRLRRRGHQGDRSDGNALVDDGDTEFFFDILPGLHQLFGVFCDFVIDFITGGVHIAVGAGEQGNAHCDGPHVQMLLVDHLDGLHDFVLIQQHSSTSFKCGAWR